MYILSTYPIIMAMELKEAIKIVSDAIDTKDFWPQRTEAMAILKQHGAEEVMDVLTAEVELEEIAA